MLVFVLEISPTVNSPAVVIPKNVFYPMMVNGTVYFFGVCGHPSLCVFGYEAGCHWRLVRKSFKNVLAAAPVLWAHSLCVCVCACASSDDLCSAIIISKLSCCEDPALYVLQGRQLIRDVGCPTWD